MEFNTSRLIAATMKPFISLVALFAAMAWAVPVETENAALDLEERTCIGPECCVHGNC
jgi:hypothetical protein